MTPRAGLLAPALAASVLAACGGPSSAPPPAAESSTRLESPGSATRDPKTVGDDPPATTETERIANLVAFISPSGNVGCLIDPTLVRCDIAERDWTPPPRPADCELDYGQGIELPVGGVATFICAGDTALGGGKPLAYGTSVSAGTLRCDSAETGITCRDSTTTRGFMIAREAFRLF